MKITKTKLDEAGRKKKGTLEAEVDQAEKELKSTGDPVETAKTKGQIESVLDDALKKAKRQQKVGGTKFTNVLLVGGAGVGKTERVFQWARENGVNLVSLDVSTMAEEDIGGIPALNADKTKANRVSSGELDDLDQPNSVLFLDEYNRGRRTVRGTLLKLINDHTVLDASVEGHKKKLKNFLFTIACINPADDNYDTDPMDDAERSRFRSVKVYANKKETLNYLLKSLEAEKAQFEDEPDVQAEYDNQIGIAKKLLSDKAFTFDSAEDAATARDELGQDYQPLNPRSFTKLLTDSADKDDFLNRWNDYCNPLKKGTVERILASYTDVNDKANDALKGGTESNVFKQHEESAFDKLNKYAFGD